MVTSNLIMRSLTLFGPDSFSQEMTVMIKMRGTVVKRRKMIEREK